MSESSKTSKKYNVGGVIVAYNPEIKEFEVVVSAALKQLDYLVVVNNGEQTLDLSNIKDVCTKTATSLQIIENHQNLGIATALNIGLRNLKTLGCSHFLLLDHDSLIPNAMVSGLLDAFISTSKTQLVAAIGPAYFNARLNKYAPFIKFGNWTLEKIPFKPKKGLIETHFLISSGSMLSLEALNEVGFMEDGLFIDYVDTEWCLRAISKGYKLYGLSDVVMEHALGDTPIILFGLSFPSHSPLRHYYLARNAILLAKKKYVPLRWKCIILLRMLRSLVFYAIVPSSRAEHFKKLMLGLRDGVLNKQGMYT